MKRFSILSITNEMLMQASAPHSSFYILSNIGQLSFIWQSQVFDICSQMHFWYLLYRRLETILIVVTNKKEIVSLPSTALVQHEGSDCVLWLRHTLATANAMKHMQDSVAGPSFE
jgi:hypothetical protein